MQLLKRFVLVAATAGAASVAAQSPRLPTVQLTAGIHLITAEVATNDATRARGLMFRASLPANHGMLFIFENRSLHCMWMRNTLIPLSVAFIDMQPHDERSHCAKRPVRYALEMTQGWFAQKGLGTGAKLGRLPAAAQQ